MANLPLLTFGVGVVVGMCGVWMFSYVHDLILNFYRIQQYKRELEKEKRIVNDWGKGKE